LTTYDNERRHAVGFGTLDVGNFGYVFYLAYSNYSQCLTING